MKCGADPNILDQNGYNALHHAVDAGVDNAIATLIEGPPTGNTSVPLIKVNPDALNLDGKKCGGQGWGGVGKNDVSM